MIGRHGKVMERNVLTWWELDALLRRLGHTNTAKALRRVKGEEDGILVAQVHRVIGT